VLDAGIEVPHEGGGEIEVETGEAERGAKEGWAEGWSEGKARTRARAISNMFSSRFTPRSNATFERRNRRISMSSKPQATIMWH